MSLLRRGVEQRAANISTLAEMLRLNGRSPRSSAPPVTSDLARQHVAVWRCQHMLADIVAGLPIDQYRQLPSGERVEVEASPFVRSPSQWVSGSEEWRYQLVLSAADRGNGYAYITEWDRSMRFARRAEVLDPNDVAVTRRGGALAAPRYFVGQTEVDPARMLHLRAFGPAPGSVLGLDPIAYAARSIRLGLESRDYGTGWYTDAGIPAALLTYDDDIDATDAETAKTRFKTAAADGLVVLGKRWNYQALQVSPDKAAFLEATNATAVEICGYYGIPPEMLGYSSQGGGSLTYANWEQRALDVLVFTVQWWIGRVERLLSSQLPADEFVKINVDALLRSDLLTRYRAHDIAIRGGFGTPNERRRIEDMPPLPDGYGDAPLWPPYSTSTTNVSVDGDPPEGGPA